MQIRLKIMKHFDNFGQWNYDFHKYLWKDEKQFKLQNKMMSFFYNNISCLVILGMPGNEWEIQTQSIYRKGHGKRQSNRCYRINICFVFRIQWEFVLPLLYSVPWITHKSKSLHILTLREQDEGKWEKKMIVFECFRGLAWIVSRIQIIPLIRFKGYTAHKY